MNFYAFCKVKTDKFYLGHILGRVRRTRASQADDGAQRHGSSSISNEGVNNVSFPFAFETLVLFSNPHPLITAITTTSHHYPILAPTRRFWTSSARYSENQTLTTLKKQPWLSYPRSTRERRVRPFSAAKRSNAFDPTATCSSTLRLNHVRPC